MDLYEYQGRELFARHGLPVLTGGVAETPAEATAIATGIMAGSASSAGHVGRQVVVKAQVKVGGRGKAGGVKLADTPAEATALGARDHDEASVGREAAAILASCHSVTSVSSHATRRGVMRIGRGKSPRDIIS